MEPLRIVPVDQIPKQVSDCDGQDWLPYYRLCLEMEAICEHAKGIGLSAVQVGVARRLYIVRFEDNGKVIYRHFVNCDYEPIGEEKFDSLEGCLSLKRADGALRHFVVKRFVKIRVKGHELVAEEKVKLKPVDEELTDIYAVVHQHEIDHQKCVLISEIGTEYEVWN